MKDCKTCGRSYDEKSFNDTVWHTRDWGCKKRIEDGFETTKKEKEDV